MSRTIVYHSVLGFMLWLTAVTGARAQSLEYWFDNGSRKPQSLSLSSSSYNGSIDASGLKTGMHTLHLRVRDGSDYSPVYSSTFLKFTPGASRLEYWFDGDVKNLASIDVSTKVNNAYQILNLDLSDSKMFPLGLHQISMRIVDASGVCSPVYNAFVMRMSGGGGGNSVLQYWFDDDNSNPATIPITTTSDAVQTLQLDLTSLDIFPYGLHKLNMRVAANGTQFSPVYSTMVMHWPNGPFNYLTYWLDDDHDTKNLKKIKASAATDVEGYFETNLNFRDAAPGMHRLHYRVSRNAIDFGPVHEEPILITRKYVKTEGESVAIIKSYWADDKQGVQNSFANKNNVLTWGHTLDPNDYSVGQHSFRVRFQNSAEVWSEENVTYFYKDAAMSRLHEGFMPSDETTGIEDLSQSEIVACECDNGTIYVDCQSPKLGKAGVITVYDMMGRVVAQQKVTNDNGIHAALSVENFARQILIVKLVCGDMHFSRKMVIR